MKTKYYYQRSWDHTIRDSRASIIPGLINRSRAEEAIDKWLTQALPLIVVLGLLTYALKLWADGVV